MEHTSAFIYVLIDPRDDEIRYVGFTIKALHERLKKHVGAVSSDTHRSRWLRQLARQGWTPRIELVQVVPRACWADAERYWIAHYRAIGCNLTNATGGGDGTLGRQLDDKTRAAISRARSQSECAVHERPYDLRDVRGWGVCRQCRSEATARWRAANPERVRAYAESEVGRGVRRAALRRYAKTENARRVLAEQQRRRRARRRSKRDA